MTLIERLQQADGPSRKLDAEIARHLGYLDEAAGMVRMPAYTASIDAALMLLPTDHKHWNVGGSPTQGFAGLGLYGACVNDNSYGESRHPAIAIVIAALSAQEVMTAWFDSYHAEVPLQFARFIISQPDPLVEAWIEATGNTVGMEPLNAAIEKRGGKIVWGDD